MRRAIFAWRLGIESCPQSLSPRILTFPLVCPFVPLPLHSPLPSSPAITSKLPSLPAVDSDTKDAGYLTGNYFTRRMVSHRGLRGQTSVNEKMLCGAANDVGLGAPGPASQELGGGTSVSRTQFPQLYTNRSTSQENCELRWLCPRFILPIGSQGGWAEDRRKQERGNGEGTGVFLICETRDSHIAS